MPRRLFVEAPSQEGASQHAFIAIPSYGPISAVCVHSLWAAQIALRAAGIKVTLEILSGNCHVDDARNNLVRSFLETDCTDLVFIDSDLGFDGVDLVKLLRYDRPVVAGVYPMKQEDEEYPVRPMPGELRADKDGLVEVMGVPTGFLRIKRYVLKELSAKAQKFLAKSDEKNRVKIPIIFERTYEGGNRFSGDYAFCEKWRNMGGEIFVDPEMAFEHTGEGSWCGSLGDFWKRSNGVYESQFDEWLSDLRSGDSSPHVFTSLFRGWGNNYAASPKLLECAYLMAGECQKPILETGSGLSTLVMAVANPGIEIHCLESDPIWASRLLEAAKKHGIENIRVHTSQIKDYGEYKWYDAESVPALDYGLVLCDGPARKLGKRFPLFHHVGINGCPVIADDAIDVGFLRQFEEWSSKNGRKVKLIQEDRAFAISYKEKS